MSLLRLISWFALVGTFIPPLLYGVWWVSEKYLAGSYDVRLFVENVLLILWPSSIFMMATAGEEGFPWMMFLVSALVNVFLYALVGMFVWLGFKKTLLFFLPLVMCLGVLWWRLLKM